MAKPEPGPAEKPPGAERLLVQLRPKSTPLRAKPAGSDRGQSLQLFHQRNAQFSYKTLAEIKSNEPWSGEIATPGELRIIAFSQGDIHVATEKLR